MLAPNSVLQGRYRIEELIAEGGMGAVYRATDTRLNNVVALKECRIPFGTANIALREKLHRQFELEAQLLANLKHHALPKVIDHFTENNGQFLVMEYIEGDDLMEMIERGGAFPTDEVLEWADQLLDALEYLHERQPPIFHRDIKPQNIKLTEKGKVVLLDFGLAKWEASSVGVGTIMYAPIEQIMSQGTDPRSDLYSLAATLYHLMTGLQAPSSYTRRFDPPDSLRPANEVNGLVSPAIADILRQALSLDREGRPANASKMRRLLRDAREQSAPAKEYNPSPVVEEVDQKKSPETEVETIAYKVIGVKLEMVRIPAGTFLMGSPDSEEGYYDDEGPQHQVTVSPFYMGKYEVTQVQWRAVATKLSKIKMDLKTDPSKFKGDNLPVEQVSWEEAIEFCERLSKAMGKTYRLPTEAEWEYACRAKTEGPYAGNLDEMAWYSNNSDGKTHPVGEKKPNGFGLYDMHGNVWEWCMDWFSGNYYSQSPSADPTGPDTGSARVERGGGWNGYARDCRSAGRGGYTPDDRSFNLGFRLVRTYN